MPSHSKINALCEGHLISSLMPRKSQSRKGPWSPPCFPVHTWGSLSPRAVPESPTPLSVLAHKQRAPSAFSLTASRVSLYELYHPAMQIIPANWDLLPFTCLLWYHTSTHCTLPLVHNIHTVKAQSGATSLLCF